MNKAIWLFLFSLWSSSLMAGWLDRKAEGWAWYEDLDKEKDEGKEEKLEIVQSQSVAPKPSPLEELARVKKELEEKLAVAILNPTDGNVATYMVMQKKWMDQSGQFSKVWSRILLEHPELDETVTGFPVSQYGIQLQKQILQEKKEKLIKELAKDQGLFFFYEGKSKASIVFTAVVKEFAKRYDWQVIAISVDGASIEGFKDNKSDNTISQAMGVKIFPSLFIINPQTKEAVPISFGLSSVEQIENNTLLQFSDLLEEI